MNALKPVAGVNDPLVEGQNYGSRNTNYVRPPPS